jgi:hypothetical protein
MRRNFWKATLISIAAYSTAVLIGFLADFRLTMFAIPGILVTWTAFCVIRVVQLRLAGAHNPDALPDDRENYGFALGGSVSSFVLLLAIVVLSQSDRPANVRKSLNGDGHRVRQTEQISVPT